VIGWDELETWLAELSVTDLEAGVIPAPVLVCGDAHGPALLVIARPEADRDGVDAVSELGVAMAAVSPDTAVISFPGRLRDPQAGPAAPPIGRSLVLTSARHDGGSLDLRVRSLPFTRGRDGDGWQVGAATDLEIELSPVASLMDDVSRHHVDHEPVQTLSVLTSWGHLVALPRGTGTVQPDPALPPPTGGARHRVHRHALELARRHHPTGPAAIGRRRPAIMAGMPEGWDPACDL
jgi:hypothetical protein